MGIYFTRWVEATPESAPLSVVCVLSSCSLMFGSGRKLIGSLLIVARDSKVGEGRRHGPGGLCRASVGRAPGRGGVRQVCQRIRHWVSLQANPHFLHLWRLGPNSLRRWGDGVCAATGTSGGQVKQSSLQVMVASVDAERRRLGRLDTAHQPSGGTGTIGSREATGSMGTTKPPSGTHRPHQRAPQRPGGRSSRRPGSAPPPGVALGCHERGLLVP